MEKPYMDNTNIGGVDFEVRDTWLRNQMAPPYDPTVEYKTEQVVIYEGRLYECIRNNSGAWNEGDWKEVRFDEYLNAGSIHRRMFTDDVGFTGTENLLMEAKDGITIVNITNSEILKGEFNRTSNNVSGIIYIVKEGNHRCFCTFTDAWGDFIAFSRYKEEIPYTGWDQIITGAEFHRRIGQVYEGNLDNLVTPGIYWIPTATLNHNITVSGGVIVEAETTRTWIIQTFTTTNHEIYTRTKKGSSSDWTIWRAFATEKYIDEKIGDIYNGDLNNALMTGMYFCYHESCSNIPVEGKSGTLIVGNAYTENLVSQTFHVINENRTFTRTKTRDSAWTAWTEILGGSVKGGLISPDSFPTPGIAYIANSAVGNPTRMMGNLLSFGAATPEYSKLPAQIFIDQTGQLCTRGGNALGALNYNSWRRQVDHANFLSYLEDNIKFGNTAITFTIDNSNGKRKVIGKITFPIAFPSDKVVRGLIIPISHINKVENNTVAELEIYDGLQFFPTNFTQSGFDVSICFYNNSYMTNKQYRVSLVWIAFGF